MGACLLIDRSRAGDPTRWKCLITANQPCPKAYQPSHNVIADSQFRESGNLDTLVHAEPDMILSMTSQSNLSRYIKH
jgi:hypothetical protein